MSEHVKLGLRFKASDEPTLRTLVTRIRSGDYASRADYEAGVDLWQKAADAAQMGEPLIVFCEDPREAHELAQGFTLVGIDAPNVVSLSG